MFHKYRKNILSILLLFSLNLFFLFACTTARKRPPLAEAVPSTPTVNLGERIFMAHCNQCHPGGEAGVGPALNNKRLPGFLIKAQVRMGFGPMPSFSKEEISKEELRAVVEYLKAMRRNKPLSDY